MKPMRNIVRAATHGAELRDRGIKLVGPSAGIYSTRQQLDIYPTFGGKQRIIKPGDGNKVNVGKPLVACDQRLEFL
jgi:hypothetical protein